MKRNLALLLAFSLLLAVLTGCEHFAGAENERPPLTPTEEPTDAPIDDPGTSAVGADYGFTVFPEGNYLADPKFDTDEYLPDYDIDLSFVRRYSTGYSWSGSPVLCSTEDTVYYYDLHDKLIMFWDKATGITGPLCGRPECTHTGSSCNAYVPGLEGMRIYDGKLYWSGGRMNLDSTERESGPWRNNTSGMNNIATTVIHRGYVYAASMGQTVTDGEVQNRAVVNAMNMETGETFNILTRNLDLYSVACEIRPVRNDLYIMTYGFKYYYDDDHSAGSYDDMEIFRWDTKTRQAELVFKHSGKETGLNFSNYFFMPVPGDGIYLWGSREKDNIVCKYSFETQEIEKLLQIEYKENETCYPLYTRDYIILAHSTGFVLTGATYDVSVYDYAWNPIASKSHGERNYFSYFMGSDEDYIYGYAMEYLDFETLEPLEVNIGRYFMIPLGSGEVIVFGESPMK